MDPIRVVVDLAQLLLEVLDLSLQSKDLSLFVLSDWQRSSVGCAWGLYACSLSLLCRRMGTGYSGHLI